MKYVVDEIIDDIVKLENISNKEICYVDINLLPDNTKETDIVIYQDNKYLKDELEKQERINRIKAKMEKLKNKVDK